ncbi:MAG: NYN domain-containing protein [Chloroflexota bacterium]
MGKNVAVFVDVANIFYAAKAAGVDIDYVTLLKAASAGRDLVRAYAYTGLDPDNENQRNFHDFLRRHGYKVVSKDIRKYGDGKVKANLDIELVVDMMKTARNLDVAIVVSGDGDFAPAIRAVQEMGVRVEVISFRGNTSSDLIEVADLFTDITQLARVDKTSSRSGRRVAGDDEDLAMTEVPDKQTEGTGQRGRGRGRGRGRTGEAEPVAARARTGTRTRRTEEPVEVAAGNGTMTVLPGEKLSRVAASPAPRAASAASSASAADVADVADEERTPFDVDLDAEPVVSDATERGDADGDGEGDEAGRRRRRRRGGRGRGRGRGREGEVLVAGEAADAEPEAAEDEDEEIPAAPRGPRTTPFGSFWDAQIGTPTAPRSLPPVGDDEDFEEPEIPEYLIAEQRRGRNQAGPGRGQGGRGGGGGGGGRRGAYNAAIERERYGRGGGGGINRYPDVSGRGQAGQGGRGGRQEGGYGRQDSSYSRGPSGGADRPDRPAPRSGDPWSEVPPELEEMLRAQLAQSSKGRRPQPSTEPSRVSDAAAAGEIETMTEAESTAPAASASKPRAPRRRTTARTETPGVEAAAGEPLADAAAETPKRRTTRRKASADEAPATDVAAEAAPAARTTVRRTRKAAPEVETDAAASPTATEEPTAPKRRTTRKKAETA